MTLFVLARLSLWIVFRLNQNALAPSLVAFYNDSPFNKLSPFQMVLKPLSFFNACIKTTKSISHHKVTKLEANPPYADLVNELAPRLKLHYTPEKILAKWGKPQLAKYLAEKLPTKQVSRSGELGEIIATEYINSGALPYEVPIKRLRWKDTREWPMRGEDIVGFNFSGAKVLFLKGEAKSRKSLTGGVISAARDALDSNRGLPQSYTLAFILERLYESNLDAKAEQLEEYVLVKLPSYAQVAHLIFTFSQNDPLAFLVADAENAKKKLPLYSVGLHVTEHQQIISRVYKKAQDG